MNNFTFPFLVRALIVSTTIFRIAILTDVCSKSFLDKRKTIGKIHHKIMKQEHTTNPIHVETFLLCGDIATNTWPAVESYTDTLNNLRKKKQNLKVSTSTRRVSDNNEHNWKKNTRLRWSEQNYGNIWNLVEWHWRRGPLVALRPISISPVRTAEVF